MMESTLGKLLSLWDPRRNVRARFALVFGLTGVLLAVAAATAVFRFEMQQLEMRVGQIARLQLQQMQRSLALRLVGHLQEMERATSLPGWVDGTLSDLDIRVALEQLKLSQSGFVWLGLVDQDGQVRVSTGELQRLVDFSARPWFQLARRQPVIGNVYLSDSLRYQLPPHPEGGLPRLLDLAIPVYDSNGQPGAVLIAHLGWELIEADSKAMLGADTQTAAADLVVTDALGQVWIGPPPLNGQRLVMPELDEVIDRPASVTLAWPDGSEHVSVGLHLNRAGPVLERVDLPDWTLLLRQDARGVRLHATELQQRVLALGLGWALMFAVLSWWLAGRLSRPIVALARTARQLQNDTPGQRSADPGPQRPDELGQLTSALHQLHERTRDQMQQREEMAQRYLALFEESPDAVCVHQDGRVVLANRACAALFGAGEARALIGRPVHTLHPPEALDGSGDGPVTGTRVRPGLHTLRRLDGEAREVEVTVSAFFDRGQRAHHVVMRDVTVQRLIERDLLALHRLLERTSALAHVGGWACEREPRQVTWTEETARIHGQPGRSALPADEALLAYDPASRSALTAAIERGFGQQEAWDLILTLQRGDGTTRSVRMQGLPVQERGRVVRLEAALQDVTELREAEDAVRALNAALEERVQARTAELTAANAELDSFAYAVSHDLRAPLRAMSGFSRSLIEDQGPRLDDEGRDDLQQIILASQRMAELIDGLLALSRITRGDLRHDEVDVSQMATRLLEELQRTEPGRQVQWQIDPGLSQCGDRRMLDALMRNLLGNAWKYTARSTPARLHVQGLRQDGRDWIAIEDNGSGFDMKYAQRLGKPFQRLHRIDEFPGLGIGLATVYRIVRRHGGDLQARGEPGRGARFMFTLTPAPVPAPGADDHEDHPAG
ncbi:PAS domain S-box-containing protein [Sphaerotilus hippei]|uniref:histidine kinase n=1 Tax=Sphaerotilus hippei TaxID=744406 RepID=A0A318H691_9BURK|nr:ATP-binding protein [Sphaerotilus hippei]PXW97968.1 PAS domain S-box-containing protein [Sphaerotilus hippei]